MDSNNSASSDTKTLEIVAPFHLYCQSQLTEIEAREQVEVYVALLQEDFPSVEYVHHELADINDERCNGVPHHIIVIQYSERDIMKTKLLRPNTMLLDVFECVGV